MTGEEMTAEGGGPTPEKDTREGKEAADGQFMPG